ncbi:MAG: serine/threonine-protein kinase [Bradymonadia bacterium]
MSQESRGWCPTCGFRGAGEVCPIDGTGLIFETQVADTSIPQRDMSDQPEGGGQKADSPTQIESYASGVESFPAAPAGSHQRVYPELTGTQLNDRYRVDEVLGRGGMGTVYAGFQPAINRTVAIKVLNPEFAANPMVVRRFHQEAQTASKLSHPNTIAIHDFGESEGHLYIVMERLKGQTLKQLLRTDGPLTLERACHLIKQVLRSVAQAHREGVIHRDIKPDNIFVTPTNGVSEHVTVLDFGVAKLRKPDNTDNTVTQMGSILGTPKYMAPEQTQDVPIDGRADLYSIGIILYEMLLGAVPFDGENPLAILMAHAHERPPSFETLRPDHGFHPAVQSVIMKTLEKARERRYDSAEALLEAVDILEQSTRNPDERFDRKKLSELIRAQDMQPGSELDLSAELVTPPRTPQHKSRLSIAILAALIGGVAMAALIWKLGQRPPQTTNIQAAIPLDSTKAAADSKTSRRPGRATAAGALERAPKIPTDSGMSVKPSNPQPADGESREGKSKSARRASTVSDGRRPSKGRKQAGRPVQTRSTKTKQGQANLKSAALATESKSPLRDIMKGERPAAREVDLESPMEFE